MSQADLQARIRAALSALDDLHSGDPAAAPAMRAIRLTRWTLERMSIAALDEASSIRQRGDPSAVS